MSCNAGRFVLQSLCKQCDLWLNVDRKHDSIDRKRVNIEGKPENIERKPVRQCRGCVRSQQLWIGSWQQKAAGPDPAFNILPAVHCAGCQLARPWLAQVGSTGFPGSLEGSQLIFYSHCSPASHRTMALFVCSNAAVEPLSRNPVPYGVAALVLFTVVVV